MKKITMNQGFPSQKILKDIKQNFEKIETLMKPILESKKRAIEIKIEQLCNLNKKV